MHGRIHAVEEPRFRQKKDAGAGGADKRTLAMHGAKPLDQLGMPVFPPALGPQQDGRDDDDVGAVDPRHGAMDHDRNPACEFEETSIEPDHLDLEGLRLNRPGPDCRRHHLERVHHVENAAQGRDHGLGNGNEAYVKRLR